MSTVSVLIDIDSPTLARMLTSRHLVDGDGAMDYMWLDQDGKGWGYLNIGKGENKWYGLGNIAKGVGASRDSIRMAVLTESRRADYVVVSEESGELNWWQNLGKDWDYDFASRGVAATGPGHTIRNEFGWDFKAKNVRFAEYVQKLQAAVVN